ncbi:hypothetical protein ACHAXA_009005 [Cyclostephanos tholiformis]|uniref:SAGA-associated factor 11 n=1 Tax=Cyclostephanos tholiformis TaxID=382380 RepID=A0ABD3R702_9STRA
MERRSGTSPDVESSPAGAVEWGEGSAATIAIDYRGTRTENKRDDASIPGGGMFRRMDRDGTLNFIIGGGRGGGGADNHDQDVHEREESTNSDANDGGDGIASIESDVNNVVIEVYARGAVADRTEGPTEGKGGSQNADLGQDATSNDDGGDAPSSRDELATESGDPMLVIEQTSAVTTTPVERIVSGGGNNNNASISTSSSITDIYGRIPGKEPKYAISCPNCGRQLSSSRLAVHLEKCMGLSSTRRGSSSTPAGGGGVKRKKSGGRKRATTGITKDDGGGVGKVSKQSRAKGKSKDSL